MIRKSATSSAVTVKGLRMWLLHGKLCIFAMCTDAPRQNNYMNV